MTDDRQPTGLDAAYGDAPAEDRKTTGDPAAQPSAATETLADLQMTEARARAAQADQETDDDRSDAPAR